MSRTRMTVDMLRDAPPEFMEQLERFAAANAHLERYPDEEAAAVEDAGEAESAAPSIAEYLHGAVPSNAQVNQLLRGPSHTPPPRRRIFDIDYDSDPDFGDNNAAAATFTSLSISLTPFDRRIKQTLVFRRPVTAQQAIEAAEQYMLTPMTPAYYNAFFRDGIIRAAAANVPPSENVPRTLEEFVANDPCEPDGTLSVTGALLVRVSSNDAQTHIEVRVLDWGLTR